MFESDDWDFDQDFLNDVDEKAIKFYSQTNSDTDTEVAKRRKVEIIEKAHHSSSRLCNDNLNSSQIHHLDVQKSNVDKRKNLILGIFNKTSTNEDNSVNASTALRKIDDNDALNSCFNLSSNDCKSRLPRKNLVLDILRKKDGIDNAMEKRKHLSNDVKDTCVTESINNSKDINNMDCQEQETIIKADDTKCHASSSNWKASGVTEEKTVCKKSNDNLRKQLLLNVLKPSSVDNTESLKTITKNDHFPPKIPQRQPNKKMTLVRRFPGPAGLLPDNMDTAIPPISYLNSLEENENDRMKDPSESNFSEYCSQHTKTLFTEGAWQLMLNDLPYDFLKGYEIATIKQTASVNGTRSTKVRFMAGILEYVDHSHDNPPIILKDFTDSIRGIVHRDIPLTYPGMLEPNVVLLLHDVGLLRTSGSLISNKYHILISPSCLLGIYSNNGKTVHTSQMDFVLRKTSNEKSNQRESDFKKPLLRHPIETNPTKMLDEFHNTSSDDNWANVSMNFDDTDNLFFSVCTDEITNTQNQKNFTSPTSKDIEATTYKRRTPKKCLTSRKENMRSSAEKQTEPLLQTLKRFNPDVNARKKLNRIPKTQQSDVEHPVVLNSPANDSLPITQDDSFGATCSRDNSNINCDSNEKNIGFNISSINNSAKTSIRSRLLQFKSNDILTPPESSNDQVRDFKTVSVSLNNSKESQTKKPAVKENRNFEDVMCDNENDTDDEMLSQLDVDSIYNDYSK